MPLLSSRFNWVTARALRREMPREAAAAVQHCLGARVCEALPARTGRPPTGRKGGLRITTGGEEAVALSSSSTVQSAFNWAHSGVRSPATRRAGGSGARGSGVGSSTALALLLSDDAVRVSPLSTRPERRRGEERDGTSALEIEGACARGQAGAYQSGSRRSLRRLRGSAAAGMNDGRCRGDDARDTGRAKHRIESHGSVSTFAYSLARTPTAASTVHAKPQKLHS